MFFTKTHKYHFSIPKEDLKNRLLGNHVKIHNLDFEVFEKEDSLHIIPPAEQVEAIKTLPITNVNMKEEGNSKTRVVITSKMREFDAGGPMLIVIFCTFMFAASMVLLYVGGDPLVTYFLLGISVFIFTIFYIRLQLGYFDYVRKVRDYVKSKAEPVAANVNIKAPLIPA
jgi:hypothetical protein